MTGNPHITVTIVFHREGAFVVPALASMFDMVETARGAGLSVETQAILDGSDDQTTHLVAVRGNWLDKIEEVSFGDLALSRNFGTGLSRGHFLSFLDGDDLWGRQWLILAHQAAMRHPAKINAIWHPEYIFYFDEEDFKFHSKTEYAQSGARSFHMRQSSSDTPGFDWRMLAFGNVWTANVLCPREIHIRFPYMAADRARGVGVEDWSWNMQTLWGGIPHYAVPGAVHMIRQKCTGSLSQRNLAEGLLPTLPSTFALNKCPSAS
jgi:hypothetical protein